jgi:hypothetical protein
MLCSTLVWRDELQVKLFKLVIKKVQLIFYRSIAAQGALESGREFN